MRDLNAAYKAEPALWEMDFDGSGFWWTEANAADDNVVAAHTLQLSSALLAAGRPHQVLPLSGVTHMTPQEVVAENLLKLQLAFLRDALASPRQGTAEG